MQQNWEPLLDTDHRFEQRWCHRIARRLGEADALVDAVPEGSLLAALRARPRPIDLVALADEIDTLTHVQVLHLSAEWLTKIRAVPGPVQLELLFDKIDVLVRLRALHLPGALFADVPPHLVELWRRGADHDGVLAYPRDLRLSRLAALCWTRQREITHELVEVLHALVHTISERLEHRMCRELERLPRCVDGTERLLVALADAIRDNPGDLAALGQEAERGRRDQPDDHRRDGRHRAGKYLETHQDTRAQSVQQLVHEAQTYERSLRSRQRRTALRRTYSPAYQQVIASIVAALEFRCDHPDRWPILLALGELLAECTSVWGKARFYDTDQHIPITGVVPEPWREAVVDERGRVERVPYELAVLMSLDEALDRKEIEVSGADEWTPTAAPAAQLPTSVEQLPGNAGQPIAWPPADERRPVRG